MCSVVYIGIVNPNSPLIIHIKLSSFFIIFSMIIILQLQMGKYLIIKKYILSVILCKAISHPVRCKCISDMIFLAQKNQAFENPPNIIVLLYLIHSDFTYLSQIHILFFSCKQRQPSWIIYPNTTGHCSYFTAFTYHGVFTHMSLCSFV